MGFIKLSLRSSPECCEILTAELAEIGFDTFEETDDGLDAYIENERYEETSVLEIISQYEAISPISFSTEKIQKKNWNKEWEKNYDPIEVNGRCRVRATFHEPDPSFDYEIVIIPKMSFGTGHHATTYNMLSLEMDYDFAGKHVVDLGTGTGVLAIMAHLRGAASIECTDVDTWCIENSQENFELNDINQVQAHLGSIDNIKLTRDHYDVVLANINKNVLLDEMPHYARLLPIGGDLFLSGFYESDIPDIEKCASSYNLSTEKTVIKDKWVAIQLTKS